MKEFDNYFKGEHTEEEEKIVTDFFLDDSHGAALEKALYKTFYNIEHQDNEKDLQHILNRIHYNINTEKGKNRESPISKTITVILKIAAVVMLPLLAIYSSSRYYQKINPGIVSTIYAPTWSKIQFILPDSTTGWLNSGSTLEYKGNFLGNRKVNLTGEAYFNVYHDPLRPFVVTTPTITARALGTKFNISSYNDEKRSELMLEEGIVEFTNRNSKEQILMKPSDLIIYDKTRDQTIIKQVESTKYTSWTEGKLIFRNDPVDVVARRIAHWYNADVTVNIDNPDNISWRATFQDESLEEVLESLALSLDLKYTVENPLSMDDGTYTKTKITITNN